MSHRLRDDQHDNQASTVRQDLLADEVRQHLAPIVKKTIDAIPDAMLRYGQDKVLKMQQIQGLLEIQVRRMKASSEYNLGRERAEKSLIAEQLEMQNKRVAELERAQDDYLSRISTLENHLRGEAKDDCQAPLPTTNCKEHFMQSPKGKTVYEKHEAERLISASTGRALVTASSSRAVEAWQYLRCYRIFHKSALQHSFHQSLHANGKHFMLAAFEDLAKDSERLWSALTQIDAPQDAAMAILNLSIETITYAAIPIKHWSSECEREALESSWQIIDDILLAAVRADLQCVPRQEEGACPGCNHVGPIPPALQELLWRHARVGKLRYYAFQLHRLGPVLDKRVPRDVGTSLFQHTTSWLSRSLQQEGQKTSSIVAEHKQMMASKSKCRSA